MCVRVVVVVVCGVSVYAWLRVSVVLVCFLLCLCGGVVVYLGVVWWGLLWYAVVCCDMVLCVLVFCGLVLFGVVRVIVWFVW